MTDTHSAESEKNPVGNLQDFVIDEPKGADLEVEVAVKDDGRVAVFHNKPFKNELSWLEFDLNTLKLDFIMDDGEIRNVGMPLTKDMAKYMQNSHQILMVLMDMDTGEPKNAYFVPVLIQSV